MGLAWALLLLLLGPGVGHRSAAVELNVPPGGRAGFTRLPPEQTGLAFTNSLSDDNAAANQIRLNGSGVALGDVDGDGRVDIFLCGLDGPNRLYRNQGGWRFEEVTLAPSVALTASYCSGAVLADVDGDGDLDLLVAAIGEGVRLFLNDGRGGFLESADSGLFRKGGATTLALADVDGDTDLDLYVANYRTATIRTTGFALLNVDGKREIPPQLKEDLELTPEGKVLEHGEPDIFYANDGTGRFRPSPWGGGRFLDESGQPLKKAPRDWGLTATFRDINQDGHPDLYVANDFHSPDRVWLNRGNGQFQAAPALTLRQTSTFSMSVDFADLDRDGWDDFFLSDMLDPRRERRMVQMSAMEPNPARIGVYTDRPQYDRNTLFRNRGDGTYAEVAYFAGLEAAGWSWSAIMMDVDLDGLEDLLLTTGHMFDTQDLDAAARIERLGPVRREQIARKLLMYPRLQLPKAAFRNRGGMRFTDAAAEWGFQDSGVCHGAAVADLDGDGDLDVVVNELNGPAGLYRNESSAPRINVRLRGQGRNTRAIGTRVSLVGAGATQSQEYQSGGRYLSSDGPDRTFAWPVADVRSARLVVAWRSGRVSTVEGVLPNHRYELVEPDDPAPERPDPSVRRPPTATVAAAASFEDVSQRLGHRHVETAFDDFQRQPLLPRLLSQPGPGVAWQDLDGDGWDDLAIGTGAGGRIAVYRNDRSGGFQPWPVPSPAVAPTRDVTGMVGDPLGGRGLLFALSNYEDGLTNGVSLRRWDATTGKVADLLGDRVSGVESLTVADWDGDGDLDVFAGGRCVAGRYPEAPGAVLLRNDGGQFVVDEAGSRLVSISGMVTGAVWTDVDADGFPELVLAADWATVRIFRNRGGRLEPWDVPISSVGGNPGKLSELTGWWTTVAAGDFDGDGRMDLLAGNWGTNTRYRESAVHPVRLRYGDFDESGSMDLLETSYDARLSKEVPERDLTALRGAVPALFARFNTFASYATVGVEEILGNSMAGSHLVEARMLRSVLLLNRGERFDLVPLPDEAQWTPVMDAAVGDFDGDGQDDVFLAQNYFAVQPTTSRSDAGLGLLLHNRGNGEFAPVPARESGLRVEGEQRACAASDFDGDGRLDLLVSQNGAETRLFRNSGARPAMRVRVQGPVGNPQGLGVALTWVEGGRRSAVREVRSGTGRLSQGSLVTLVATMGRAGVMEARWPGGAVTTTPVPEGTLETVVKRP